MGIGTLIVARGGFFFGWWVVFVSAAIVFLTGGTFFYGFSALFDPIVDEFGWSRAAVAFGFSLRSEIGGLGAPLVGLLVDRLGSRRLMAAGVVIVALGFFLLSRVQALWQFYGAVVVIALGMSSAGGAVGMVAIAHWFRRRLGRALAIMALGGGASGLMVMVLAWLISAFDWRNALAIIALLQVAVCLPLALSIRDRPEEMGMQADGEAEPWPDGEAAAQAAGPRPDAGLDVRQALRSSSFWKLAIAMALVSLGTISIVVHLIPFLKHSVGLSEGVAAAAMTAMTLLTLVGRFGFGYLADIVDKRKAMAGASALAAISILLLATVHQGWQVVLVLPIFSLGWGGVIPVRPALQAEYFGLRAFGAIQGLVFGIGTLGAVVGPVLAGWMYDMTDSYRLSFVILSAAGMLAVPLVLGMRRPMWGEVAPIA